MGTVGAYEAKTHLASLLKRVAGGEQITITKHGVPVAVLQPYGARPGVSRAEVVRRILQLRSQHRLNGIPLRELIDEGRSGHG